MRFVTRRWLLFPRELIISVGQDERGVGQRAVFCDLRHVTHVERANGAETEPPAPAED